MKRIHLLLLSLTLVLPLMTGCTKEYGHVTGVVKVNGDPIEGAEVMFTPSEEGRASNAVTEADGSYELNYTPGIKGAKIGQHTVTISCYEERSVDEDGTILQEGLPERFPPEYNDDPTVTVEVTSGSNVHDFDVQADKDSYRRIED